VDDVDLQARRRIAFKSTERCLLAGPPQQNQALKHKPQKASARTDRRFKNRL